MKTLRFLLAATLAAPAVGLADVVHLKDGRALEGAVQAEGDALVIRQRLGEVRVRRADVVRIEETEDRWDRLERLEDELARGTAEERYRFAAWARDHDFPEEAREAFLSVLRVDANHPGARAALGYVLHEGRWVTVEDRNRARGLVEHRGEWLTPEERAEKVEAERQLAAARREERRRAREAEREERRAEREAEREARRERIRAYELELARARARERARREADVPVLGASGPAIVNGVYVPGAYSPNRVLGGRYVVPGCGVYRGAGLRGRRGYRGDGTYSGSYRSWGASGSGSYDGGSWGVRFRWGN